MPQMVKTRYTYENIVYPTFRESAVFNSNLSFFQLNLQILRQY